MALTRKFLAALGIEDDKIDEIITAHTEVTDSLKAERDKYKADADKLPDMKKELDTFKEKAAGNDPLKAELEKLQKEYKEFKADVETKALTAKKEQEFKNILKEIGISEKRIDSVIKVSDVNSKINFDEEGKVVDGNKLKESLKAEWADFISTSTTEGAKVTTPPTNNAGKTTMTREQIRAIPDASARQKAMAENPSLFPGLPEN